MGFKGYAALLTTLALVVPTTGLSALPAAPPPVAVRVVAERETVGAGDEILVGVVLDIAEGWHVYGKEIPAGEAGLPTAAEWTLPEGFSAEESMYPQPTRFASEGGSGYGYAGRAVIVSRLRAPTGLEAGAPIDLSVRVSYLACERLCVPGSADLQLRLVAGPAGTSIPTGAAPAELAPELLREAVAAADRPGPAGGAADLAALGLAVALAFLGGILLNLMPCVLPVLSLKISSLVRDAEAEPRLRALRGLSYGAGVLVSFWAIAAALLVLRAGGAAVGWGFQFQEPRILAVVASVFFLIALNLFGVYELGTRLAAAAGGAASAGGRRGTAGIASAFGSGFLATAAATPCTAPFMGAALGWAISQSALSALSVFTALGIGMALPFVLVSLWPALARRLPAPGRWMESLRQAMGFPMAGTTLWMVYLLGRISGQGAVFALLAALLAASVGAWIWGRWGTPASSAAARRLAAVAALALVFAPLAGVLAAVGNGGLRGSPAVEAGPGAAGQDEEWEPWSAARVAELRERGVPVFVDFGADWCLSCAFNEATVLDTREIRELFAAKGVVVLKGDWTARDDAIARELESHGRAGVPLYLLYPAGGGPPRILPELLTRGIVEDALADLPDAAGE